MKPVAIVIPWFGPDQKGGAEQHAWQLATRLAACGQPVEVLTTCCRGFLDDWAVNHWPAGEERMQGMLVRRFPVDTRDRPAFENACHRLWSVSAAELTAGAVLPAALSQGWMAHGIQSAALLAHIAACGTRYRAIIVLPYLYGLCIQALAAAGDRGWLQPCLHDEVYAYLPEVRESFERAARLLFISPGEQVLAARLFGPLAYAKGEVAGAGVEFDRLTCSGALPEVLAGRRFYLCLGRRDRTKNTDFLVEAFAVALESGALPEDVDLVLAGPGMTRYTHHSGRVHDLGLVDDATRCALLSQCLALAQPSTSESFSRVMYEAWYCGRPVLAHGDCLATATAVEDCGGGFTPRGIAEWSAHLNGLASGPAPLLDQLGARGRRQALEHADWERVIGRYLTALRPVAKARALPEAPDVVQLTPALSAGDAISNAVRWLRDALAARGLRSRIAVLHLDPRVADEAEVFSPATLQPDSVVLYHHSIGSTLTQAAAQHPGPRLLIYHNITPGRFFAPWRPEFAAICDQGRSDLPSLAGRFPLSVGDSRFNAEELSNAGFHEPGVLPLAISPGTLLEPPDPHWHAHLRDGRRNLLFVGRYSPNKCQHELITLFEEYQRFDPHSRLLLVGKGDAADPYVQALHARRAASPARADILITRQVDAAGLHACYRAAHAFVSYSEHEGFCVPLIEAMWFDVPVLAFSAAAVPETLAGSGVLFLQKGDPTANAALLYRMLHTDSLRAEVLRGQRARRKDFLDGPVNAALDGLLQRLLPSHHRAHEPKRRARLSRVAFVVMRCGQDVNGGAEALARDVALRLSERVPVDILSTCARDFVTWENVYPAGETRLGKACRLHRFPVAWARDNARFNRYSEWIAPRIAQLSDDEQAAWVDLQGPYSPALSRYIEEHGEDYQAFFFFTYGYATTVHNLPRVADKAFLVPLAHQEWILDLPAFDRLFAAARACVFQTPEERALLLARFKHLDLQGPVAATGLTAPRDTDPERIRQAHGLGRPFVLYLGRVDVAKGCDRLIDDYLALLSHEPDLPDLVLVGGCTMPVPTHPRIHALGFVDDRTRFDALAACEFLINPSAHESLSLVLLEAWQLGKPVLVNANCAVLHGQVLRSGGGFSYSEPAAFAAGFRALADPSTRRRLGAAGQNYVQQHYSWDQVVGAYLELVEALPGRSH